jgi:hypothetical protein
MTIAVQNKSRRISQARGRFNATPKGKNEKAVPIQALHRQFLQCSGQALHLWKEQEGLTQRRRT